MPTEAAAVEGSNVPDGPKEDLTFHPSPEVTLGVELELQILDRETGDLAPGSARILPLCEQDKVEGVTAELLQSMIEIKTGVCKDAAAVRDSFVPRIRRVRNIAASLGYDLALGGTHPFNRASSGAVYPAERYKHLQERMAGLTYQIQVFGLHVHVGMPSGDLAMGVTNVMVQYLPHLLALSANSPFWQGVDSGLASARAAMFRLTPSAGPPHYFANWKDFRTYVEVMRDSQAIGSTKDIYWDIRPRPAQGTIEFRICDVPPSLAETYAIVALIHCLALATLRLLQDRPRLGRGDLRRFWIVPENKWLATRYGLQAPCIRSPGRKRQTLAHDLEALLEQLRPVAEEIGESKFLEPFAALARYETGSERQRRLYREAGDWKPVIADMKQRLAQELDGGV